MPLQVATDIHLVQILRQVGQRRNKRRPRQIHVGEWLQLYGLRVGGRWPNRFWAMHRNAANDNI